MTPGIANLTLGVLENHKPTQSNDPWYIPAIPTEKEEFDAPYCPFRALRYFFHHMKEKHN